MWIFGRGILVYFHMNLKLLNKKMIKVNKLGLVGRVLLVGALAFGYASCESGIEKKEIMDVGVDHKANYMFIIESDKGKIVKKCRTNNIKEELHNYLQSREEKHPQKGYVVLLYDREGNVKGSLVIEGEIPQEPEIMKDIEANEKANHMFVMDIDKNEIVKKCFTDQELHDYILSQERHAKKGYLVMLYDEKGKYLGCFLESKKFLDGENK